MDPQTPPVAPCSIDCSRAKQSVTNGPATLPCHSQRFRSIYKCYMRCGTRHRRTLALHRLNPRNPSNPCPVGQSVPSNFERANSMRWAKYLEEGTSMNQTVTLEVFTTSPERVGKPSRSSRLAAWMMDNDFEPQLRAQFHFVEAA